MYTGSVTARVSPRHTIGAGPAAPSAGHAVQLGGEPAVRPSGRAAARLPGRVSGAGAARGGGPPAEARDAATGRRAGAAAAGRRPDRLPGRVGGESDRQLPVPESGESDHLYR